MSDEPLGTSLPGRKDFGCNVYSSGEDSFVECVMPRAQGAILDYFKLVNQTPDFEDTPTVFNEDASMETSGSNVDSEIQEPAEGINGAHAAADLKDRVIEVDEEEQEENGKVALGGDIADLEDKFKDTTVRDLKDN